MAEVSARYRICCLDCRGVAAGVEAVEDCQNLTINRVYMVVGCAISARSTIFFEKSAKKLEKNCRIQNKVLYLHHNNKGKQFNTKKL